MACTPSDPPPTYCIWSDHTTRVYLWQSMTTRLQLQMQSCFHTQKTAFWGGILVLCFCIDWGVIGDAYIEIHGHTITLVTSFSFAFIYTFSFPIFLVGLDFFFPLIIKFKIGFYCRNYGRGWLRDQRAFIFYNYTNKCMLIISSNICICSV